MIIYLLLFIDHIRTQSIKYLHLTHSPVIIGTLIFAHVIRLQRIIKNSHVTCSFFVHHLNFEGHQIIV